LTNQPKGIISSVLSPACRIWLRSQVSQVDHLHVDIAGGSRQILGGTIPRVAVVAAGAIYQGLSLGSIDLIADNIRINLPQVMRGQPLRLLEPIGVAAEAKFTEADLQASLASPLLSQALTDLLSQILATRSASATTSRSNQTDRQMSWHRIEMIPHQLILHGNLLADSQPVPLKIAMGIDIRDGHILDLDPIVITCPIELPGSDITSHQIDLGTEVNITQLLITTGELICQGQIQVNP
jgi:LmeA-like phospholipid-binding